MEIFYGDIVVTEKRRLRIQIEHDGDLTKELVLSALKEEADESDIEIMDILDSETHEYLSVEEICKDQE